MGGGWHLTMYKGKREEGEGGKTKSTVCQKVQTTADSRGRIRFPQTQNFRKGVKKGLRSPSEIEQVAGMDLKES